MDGTNLVNFGRQRRREIRRAKRAFTLLELLTVAGLALALMALLAPAFVGMARKNNLSRTTNEVGGLLEQARTYAMAHNTFVFVGFEEVDVELTPDAVPQRPGVGRVAIVVFASDDGTRGYDFDRPTTSWHQLKRPHAFAISKVWHFENIHLAASLGPPPEQGPMGKESGREDVGRYYRLGHSDCKSVTPIVFPVGSGDLAQYHFEKVIHFDPEGVARIQFETNGDEIKQFMEIGLQVSDGNQIPPLPPDANIGLHTAIQLDCLSGSVRIYRP